MSPAFSIIIPVYNVAPYLRECLDSVLAQTFTDWECICIDDGSTDGSGAILDEYAAKDSRFRVFHQQNAGPSQARNNGLRHVQGQWLSFIDADDYIASDYFSIFAEKPDKADINWFAVKFLYDDGTTNVATYSTSGVVTDHDEIIHHLYRLLHNNSKLDLLGYTFNKFFRASLVLENDIHFVQGLNLCEDEVFTLECVQIANSIRIDEDVLYFYRWNSQGLTQSRKKKVERLVESYSHIADIAKSDKMRRFVQMRTAEVASWLMGYDPSLDNAKKFVCALFPLRDRIENRYARIILRFAGVPSVAAFIVKLLAVIKKYPAFEYRGDFINAEYIKPEIAFRYVPHDWDEEKFAAAGGFVAVVLNYNKKGMIRAAAESALNQDFPCYEIVMLDDASSDGSYSELLHVAESYARRGGKMKVTVVHNVKNRGIIGQWDIAIKIVPNGKWFGMFCGDDMSYPWRISTIAELIREYPSVWGVCTNLDVIGDGRFGMENQLLVWRGTDLMRPRKNFYGSSAFWKRDVLKCLPLRTNLDDFVLFWSVIIRRFGDPFPALLWAQDRVTIKYRVGSGITTSIGNHAREAKSWLVRTYREAKANRAAGRKFGMKIWRIIADYDTRFGRSKACHEQVAGHGAMAEMDSSGWIGRMCIFLRECVIRRNNGYGGHGKMVREYIAKEFFRYLFGASGYCIYRLFVQARGWTRRRIGKKE